MSLSCFVYIDLNSSENEKGQTQDKSKASVKHTSSSIKHSHAKQVTSKENEETEKNESKPKETEKIEKSFKKLTRQQYFSEAKFNKETEEKPLVKKIKKEIKKNEIEIVQEKTPEKTPESQTRRSRKEKVLSTKSPSEKQEKTPQINQKSETAQKVLRSEKLKANQKKSTQPSEKLSLDEFIRKIETDLDLEKFASKAESYQKEINILEENIYENKILEELKDEAPNEKLTSKLPNPINEKSIEKSTTPTKDPIKALEQPLNALEISEKPQEEAIEQESSTILLRETIQEMKKLKKLHTQKISPTPLNETLSHPTQNIQELKKFLLSSNNHPNQPKYKLANFPKDINSLKKKGNDILRGIYKDFLKYELKDHEIICDVCLSKESDDDNLIIICDLCEGAVHQDCYGSELARYLPDGVWYCSRCKYLIENHLNYKAIKCIFCPEFKGIIKQINTCEKLWGHINCVLNMPKVTFLDGKDREIVSLDEFYKNKTENNCGLCGISYGGCIKCESKCCDKYFHASCGHRQGFLFYENNKFQALCKIHLTSYSKRIRENMQKKLAEYNKLPNKYSLIAKKDEYLWVGKAIPSVTSETVAELKSKNQTGRLKKTDRTSSPIKPTEIEQSPNLEPELVINLLDKDDNNLFINLNDDEKVEKDEKEQSISNSNEISNKKSDDDQKDNLVIHIQNEEEFPIKNLSNMMEIEKPQMEPEKFLEACISKTEITKKLTMTPEKMFCSFNNSNKTPEKLQIYEEKVKQLTYKSLEKLEKEKKTPEKLIKTTEKTQDLGKLPENLKNSPEQMSKTQDKIIKTPEKLRVTPEKLSQAHDNLTSENLNPCLEILKKSPEKLISISIEKAIETQEKSKTPQKAAGEILKKTIEEIKGLIEKQMETEEKEKEKSDSPSKPSNPILEILETSEIKIISPEMKKESPKKPENSIDLPEIIEKYAEKSEKKYIEIIEDKNTLQNENQLFIEPETTSICEASNILRESQKQEESKEQPLNLLHNSTNNNSKSVILVDSMDIEIEKTDRFIDENRTNFLVRHDPSTLVKEIRSIFIDAKMDL